MTVWEAAATFAGLVVLVAFDVVRIRRHGTDPEFPVFDEWRNEHQADTYALPQADDHSEAA